ncbi:hypothetical protein [Thermobispora bispora]|uniref:hypothetical protein n=1 Tax=Thermobispora bispora TaxID=2006 RepID=UPI00197FC9D3|nr:hypothetical protein [Thermobispora bispora]QSI49970.1 hypothetical protein CYL17_18510 [Thermobispora bispora]
MTDDFTKRLTELLTIWAGIYEDLVLILTTLPIPIGLPPVLGPHLGKRTREYMLRVRGLLGDQPTEAKGTISKAILLWVLSFTLIKAYEDTREEWLGDGARLLLEITRFITEAAGEVRAKEVRAEREFQRKRSQGEQSE